MSRGGGKDNILTDQFEEALKKAFQEMEPYNVPPLSEQKKGKILSMIKKEWEKSTKEHLD